MMSRNYIITIGRQLGSGGSAMGRFIADRFGFQYIDKEILVKAGEKLGLSKENLELVDEKNSSIWTSLAQTAVPEFPYNSDAWYVPTSRQLFEIQTQIMREAVKESSCVIIGRCASHLFSGYENHTSIFLQADIKSRVARLEKTLGTPIDLKKERHLIEKEDHERAKYYHTYTGKNWLDLTEYDFVLDTSHFEDWKVEEILLHYLCYRFPALK